MYPFHYPLYRAKVDTGLIQSVARAVNGEYSAIACYEQLARLAENEEQRRRITEIRRDEMKHFQTFSQIYTSLTGHPPSPKQTEECPKNYIDGLQAAIKDEQETVDFYLDTSDRTADPQIKEAFRRAAADEQNHAVWFLFFYTKLCCGK